MLLYLYSSLPVIETKFDRLYLSNGELPKHPYCLRISFCVYTQQLEIRWTLLH
jgi:hypothetical protein